MNKQMKYLFFVVRMYDMPKPKVWFHQDFSFSWYNKNLEKIKDVKNIYFA